MSRILPYLHPLWQVTALGIAVWTLVFGLRLRALRRRGAWTLRAPLVGRHARAGIVFVTMLLVGYGAGPLTLALVRQEPVFRSWHALFATLVVVLFVYGAYLGIRLWRGRAGPEQRDLHVFCMGLGLFFALVTVMLGLGLLP